ncbi:BolA family protein [Ideonella sp.]|jgi:BolA protein|uniref:BolA family protein n=1 Tax=Ideonella sp. TaxID=1929293 RepID=UPI0037BF365B
MNPPRVHASAVEAALKDALEPVQLEVSDDSAAHAGHAGAREGSHFSVVVVSPLFEGKRLLERHRLVYDALRLLVPQGIHALAIQARAPSELGR